MNRTGQKLLATAMAALGVVAVVAWLWHRRADPTTPSPVLTAPATAGGASAANSPAATAPNASPVGVSASGLQDTFGSLKTAPDAKTARPQLSELRGILSAMPTNTAVAAIRQFLDSKADSLTHLGFKVATTGFLNDAPTMRTLLLDELARLDPTAGVA